MPYVENTLYSTNKYSCVRRVHTLYISYFLEHNGDDEPHGGIRVEEYLIGESEIKHIITAIGYVQMVSRNSAVCST